MRRTVLFLTSLVVMVVVAAEIAFAVKAGSSTNRAFVSHKSTELDASDNIDRATASATQR